VGGEFQPQNSPEQPVFTQVKSSPRYFQRNPRHAQSPLRIGKGKLSLQKFTSTPITPIRLQHRFFSTGNLLLNLTARFTFGISPAIIKCLLGFALVAAAATEAKAGWTTAPTSAVTGVSTSYSYSSGTGTVYYIRNSSNGGSTWLCVPPNDGHIFAVNWVTLFG
jgi:hypothetical protein